MPQVSHCACKATYAVIDRAHPTDDRRTCACPPLAKDYLSKSTRSQVLDVLPFAHLYTVLTAISWLFFRLGLALPHIVAGENLNMPVVGPMLAKCGAFFIRRTFGDDPLYSTVVKEYIEQLLENGKNSASSRLSTVRACSRLKG